MFLQIIPAHVFSKEDTKSTKFGVIIFRNLTLIFQGRVSNPPLPSQILFLRPLRSLRLTVRIRTGPVPTGPYFVTYVQL